MAKLALLDTWKDRDITYAEIKIGKYEACCVKETEKDITTILFEKGGDMCDVYSNIGGADFPLRRMGEKEFSEVIDFARSYI